MLSRLATGAPLCSSQALQDAGQDPLNSIVEVWSGVARDAAPVITQVRLSRRPKGRVARKPQASSSTPRPPAGRPAITSERLGSA